MAADVPGEHAWTVSQQLKPIQDDYVNKTKHGHMEMATLIIVECPGPRPAEEPDQWQEAAPTNLAASILCF